MPIKLKEEHKNTYVAFGKSNKVLGEREDLYLLAELGRNRNRDLLKYFDDPKSITDEDIDKAREEHFQLLQGSKRAKLQQKEQQKEQIKEK
jgi:hypothetical protein